MSTIIESIQAEYLHYKTLAEAAIGQLSDDQLSAQGPNGSNSIATICWHISGNLDSRFSDFLTSDGEKPWRDREAEFQARTVSRAELLAKWEVGWRALFGALATLTDDQLTATVAIRGQPLLVQEALHRSLAHLSYHVGQIVYVAKSQRGTDWDSLSIPPGESSAYNLKMMSKASHGSTEASSSNDLSGFPDAWLRAWNSHDLDDIMSHYADDASLVSPTAATFLGDPAGEVRGKPALRAYFQKGLDAYPTLRFEVLDVMWGVRSVVVCYMNQKGTKTAEFMELSASGKVMRVVANYSS